MSLTWVGIFLLIYAAWGAFSWSRLYARVTRDPRARDENGKRTKFYKTHATLYAIELILALIAIVFGVGVLSGWFV